MFNIRLTAMASAVLVCMSAFSAESSPSTGTGPANSLKYGFRLYEKGMYVKAREIFSSYPEDPIAGGYAVLCEVKMKTTGYEVRMRKYLDTYPYSGLAPKIRYAYALNLFDEGDYAQASAEFSDLAPGNLYKDILPEYTYKKAYSEFRSGNENDAVQGFLKVSRLPRNDYQAPAAYSLAYIYYENKKFTPAEEWFGKASADPRFKAVSLYYILECRFMSGDYRYVVDHGESMYESVPQERKSHLARIISESFLVLGDPEKAKAYYDRTDIGEGTGRMDLFYAGSLLYALQDYKGAVAKFSMMPERTDSLGQIANYQLGYSCIQIKNKVAALQAFKDAAAMDYNWEIQEDAWFNYAKLAFDLNNDASVFESYLSKYSDSAKGDRIYAYMAIAALYRHDYAGAIETYDKIDVLDADMKRNYMKANYLYASQLIESGSFRKAVPSLKAAAYYSDRRSVLNQMSRYWLAESYYRGDDWPQASAVFKELYNISALDDREEGALLPYDIAYCYYKAGNWKGAEEWFDIYVQSEDKTMRRDAFTRIGDCRFIVKDYGAAVTSYEAAVKEFPDLGDLYPYYQAGLCLSLADSPREEIELLSEVPSASPSASFYSETMYELGRAYMSAGDNNSASDVFAKLSDSSKDSSYVARALLSLGMIATSESKYDDALGYYKRVVSEMPSSGYTQDAISAIESIYQKKQEPEKYFAYLKTLPVDEVNEDKETMFFNASEQIFLAENYQKAVTSLQAYLSEYPHGAHVALADFYMGESYKNLGKKEQACDWYKKVIDEGGAYVEQASLNFAMLSYDLQKYADAFYGYQSLSQNARIENNRHIAVEGMMNSAYHAKDYSAAIENAKKLGSDPRSDADDKRRASYVEAKSYLATSHRDEAFAILKTLSAQTKTPEGAEAAYLLIQDVYDQGRFEDVQNMVYAFSDSGTTQNYWLAKAFIVLGDSFAERGDMTQAKATFESIRDGYKSENQDDDVLEAVEMRLGKLSESMGDNKQ